MSDLPERPLIRPVEVKEIDARGETAFVLRDPLRLSDEPGIVLPLVGLAVCELMDGKRTLPEIAKAFEERHKVRVPLEQVEVLVRALDERCLLAGGRARAIVDAWRKDPVRKAACAGGSYPGEAEALRGFLDAQYTREGGPGAGPEKSSKRRPIRGLLSPHIDFHRGAHAYAHAWKAVAESCEADLFVVFGTAHQGTDTARFALTRKSYETPLGTIETDQELVERLVKAYDGPDDLFAGELAHKGEHSIEFQMVELAHLYADGAERARKIRALPVLCGSIHDLLDGPKKPSEERRVRAFHDALAKALDGVAPERVCFVGGVDLAHVGVEFGDPKLTPKKLEKYMAQDRATLEIVTGEQDGDAFHADVAADESRKICGHSPIHATLEALSRLERSHAGELLCHERWYDGQSSVTFCSVVFTDRKKR